MLAFFVAVLIIFALLFPFVVIWSINTLFGFGIEYTFLTYLASLILTNLISGSGNHVIKAVQKESKS